MWFGATGCAKHSEPNRGPHPILVHVDWSTVRLKTNRKFPTGLKAGLKIVKMPTLTTVADGDGQAPTLETLRSW